jgi:hypothetical protein
MYYTDMIEQVYQDIYKRTSSSGAELSAVNHSLWGLIPESSFRYRIFPHLSKEFGRVCLINIANSEVTDKSLEAEYLNSGLKAIWESVEKYYQEFQKLDFHSLKLHERAICTNIMYCLVSPNSIIFNSSWKLLKSIMEAEK